VFSVARNWINRLRILRRGARSVCDRQNLIGVNSTINVALPARLVVFFDTRIAEEAEIAEKSDHAEVAEEQRSQERV
jgi:hypothetical protein